MTEHVRERGVASRLVQTKWFRAAGRATARLRRFARTTDPVCRQWVRPRITNKTCREALEAILRPVGLKHRIKDRVIVLERR